MAANEILNEVVMFGSAASITMPVVFLAAGLGLQAEGLPISVQTSPVFSRYGITVIGSDHPDFKSVLTTLLGDKTVANSDDTLRWVLLVTNKGTRPVSLITGRWDRTARDGRIIFGHSALRLEGQSVNPLGPGKTVILAPSNAFGRALALAQQGRASAAEVRASAAYELPSLFDTRRFMSCNVYLDSVLFDDGLLVGPDVSGTALGISQREMAEDRALADLQNVSLSTIALREKYAKFVSQQRDLPLPFTEDGALESAVREQVSVAKSVVFLIDERGREQAIEYLRAWTKRSRNSINPVKE